MSVRLSVNIDHVATIREARKTKEPDPVTAAMIAQMSGADGITLHLRSDRRHINERDLNIIKRTVVIPVTLEMAATDEMLGIAIKEKPDVVTLVPEKPDEITTEGGLDVSSNFNDLKEAIYTLQQSGIKVCLFVNADMEQIGEAKRSGAEMVELNTGTWVESLTNDKKWELERIKKALDYTIQIGLTPTAGHGLTYHSVPDIAAIQGLHELSIGHTIVSRAVFVGLGQAVREMKDTILNATCK